MDIVSVVLTFLTIAVVGFLFWLVTENVPMAPPFKAALNVAAVILVVVYILAVLVGRAPLVSFPAIRA